MPADVQISNLVKKFGPFTAVNDVTFSVSSGEILGFLGPNGAGKSTTMKMITGFLTPTSGRISVCGHDVLANPLAAKRRIGYLPEGAPLYSDMTPRGFLNFIADIRGLTGRTRLQRFDEIVERVQLDEVLDQPIDTLSKGFKRRVGLAQAILHDPDVLILDEPTDGLDPNQKHEVRRLILDMAADKVIILSTHILEEVDAVCSRAIIIAKGEVVADDTPAGLETRSPRHGAVALTVSWPDDANGLVHQIGSIAGVDHATHAEQRSGIVTVTAFPKPGAVIGESVFQFARSKNLAVEEFRVERGRLDDVFRKLTTGNDDVDPLPRPGVHVAHNEDKSDDVDEAEEAPAAPKAAPVKKNVPQPKPGSKPVAKSGAKKGGRK